MTCPTAIFSAAFNHLSLTFLQLLLISSTAAGKNLSTFSTTTTMTAVNTTHSCSNSHGYVIILQIKINIICNKPLILFKYLTWLSKYIVSQLLVL